MRHEFIRRILYLLFSLVAAATATPSASAADGYDVSYVWSQNLAAVQDYREKVIGILGPGVAARLKVVSDDRLFGVIYQRRGSSAGATRVARSHTDKLVAGGLDPAAPIAARDWVFIDTDASRKPSTAAPAKRTDPPKPANEQVAKAKVPGRTHSLEAAIEQHIKELRREGRIAEDEQTAWSVYDFTTGKKLVTINEDVQFQAASLIKPFIALAFFHQVEQGKLAYTSQARGHLKRMIQRSCNRSTNWVMRKVGGPQAVQRILTRHYRSIFRDTRIVEYIPAGGRTYRNKASAHDYSRFLYALWKQNIPHARELKRLMALPGADRIYTGVSEIPRGTRVYNKTGSTSRLCGDMGILSIKGPDGRRYSYTLIGIIEKRHKANNYSTWIRSRGDVIREISGIVYKNMMERHSL